MTVSQSYTGYAVAVQQISGEDHTDISNGYTIAFARTAPVAPARALPHGGSGSWPPLPAIEHGNTVVQIWSRNECANHSVQLLETKGEQREMKPLVREFSPLLMSSFGEDSRMEEGYE